MSRKQVHKHFQRRRSGVLLHPTSFPAASTEGALGNDAYRFIQFLADSGFTIWQMLPVNTTDDHGSPYQGTSVHAGNPRLISLRNLAEKKLAACSPVAGPGSAADAY